jgi:hypothetical protein
MEAEPKDDDTTARRVGGSKRKKAVVRSVQHVTVGAPIQL